MNEGDFVAGVVSVQNYTPPGSFAVDTSTQDEIPDDNIAVIVDGRRSFTGNPNLSGVSMKCATIGTSHVLEICHNTIISPYLFLFKLIGWRKFSSEKALQESLVKKILNMMYPSFIFLLLLLTFIARVIICFDRTRAIVDRINGSFSYIDCERAGLVSRYVVHSLIILVSYLFGLYTFRISHREYLLTLIEKVFLDFAEKYGKFSQRRLLYNIRVLCFLAVTWMIFSTSVNLLRIKSHRLIDKDTYVKWLTSYNVSYLAEEYSMEVRPPLEHYELRVALAMISVAGFILIDFFYIALVVNYTLQCQVIYFAVCATVNKFKTIHYQVDASIKEIKLLQDFLAILNGRFSPLMSLMLFVFVGNSLKAIVNVTELKSQQPLAIVTGVGEFLGWFLLLCFVVMQAVRVTSACTHIKCSGLERRTRPFAYTRTQQIELDSFLLYTSSITMDARLVHIPMKPLLVAPVLFAVAVIWRSLFTDSLRLT